MRERVWFEVEVVVNAEPIEIENFERKLLNLSKKEEVVSFHLKKTYL